MTAISCPQLQAVNGSRCRDQRVSQFDAVAFRKHPQVVAPARRPISKSIGTHWMTAERSSRILCSSGRAPCQSSATVTGEHTSTAWLRARLSHLATSPASRPLETSIRRPSPSAHLGHRARKLQRCRGHPRFPSCYDGYPYCIHDLRYQRDCPCEGIFRGAQERSAMSAGLESGCHNDIDTGFLQSYGLVPCRRGADREDVRVMTLFETYRRGRADCRSSRPRHRRRTEWAEV